MATIEPRISDDGIKTFRVKIRIKGFPPETASFLRLTDAKRWAQATEAAMREGRYFKTSESKRHTVGEMIDRYINMVVPTRPKNAENTKRHLDWWKVKIGHTLLSDVTPPMIANLRDELLTTPKEKGGARAPATVVRYLASISHAFTIAIKDWAWLESNPVQKISKPREPRGRERYLSNEERQALLGTCKESKSQFLYTVFVVAVSTGMRSGEILSLKWQQVDFELNRIILTDTKSNCSRAVGLSGLALSLMSNLRQQRRFDTDLVFYGRNLVTPIDLTKPWRTALKKAAIENFRFHDLRHTAASYLAMNGATITDVAAILGHKTLAMAKRYSHLSNSHTAGVVAAMNDKVFGQQVAKN